MLLPSSADENRKRRPSSIADVGCRVSVVIEPLLVTRHSMKAYCTASVTVVVCVMLPLVAVTVSMYVPGAVAGGGAGAAPPPQAAQSPTASKVASNTPAL